MVMQPLVSVIVPIYNVEEYLSRCIGSLCRQSLYDIEILLVDDASQDKCGEICDVYAKKDARIRVLRNKTNQGLSVARNIGIANANSDYLMFVDSDDWVHEDFCKDAYEHAMHYQADLVLFRFQCVKKDIKFDRSANETKRFMLSGYKTWYEAMDLLQKDVGSYAWNKLYRKELFHNISYPPGYLFEDLGVTYKLVWKASRIYYLDRVLYYYCYRDGSIVASKTEKALNDRFELFMQQYHDLEAWCYPKDKLNAFLKNIAIDFCIKKKPDPADERYIFCENILIESKGVPDNFVLERKVLFYLFKYCRPLFEVFCTLYNKKYC